MRGDCEGTLRRHSYKDRLGCYTVHIKVKPLKKVL
jgi:hypothetical protein